MNRNTREQSPANEGKKSLASKRGIFTSKKIEEKPSVVPYLDNSLQGLREGIESLKLLGSSSGVGGLQTSIVTHNLDANYLNTSGNAGTYINSMLNADRIRSQQIHRGTTPTKVNFNYIGAQQHSHNQFPNLSSNQVPNVNHIQYVPINQNSVQQNVAIKRTVIPVHYYNQIPARIVVNQQTPPYTPANQPGNQVQNDEAYQILLNQYQKLYAKLESTQKQNHQFEETIKKLRLQIKMGHQTGGNGRTNRAISLNIEQLHKRLQKIYERAVKDILNKRKQRAKERLSDLFTSARRQITTIQTEQVTTVYKTYS